MPTYTSSPTSSSTSSSAYDTWLPPTPLSTSSGISGGAVAGIIIGALALLILPVLCYIRHRRRKTPPLPTLDPREENPFVPKPPLVALNSSTVTGEKPEISNPERADAVVYHPKTLDKKEILFQNNKQIEELENQAFHH